MCGRLQITFEFAFIFGKQIQISVKWSDLLIEIRFTLNLLMAVMPKHRRPISYLNSQHRKRKLMTQHTGARVLITGKGSTKKLHPSIEINWRIMIQILKLMKIWSRMWIIMHQQQITGSARNLHLLKKRATAWALTTCQQFSGSSNQHRLLSEEGWITVRCLEALNYSSAKLIKSCFNSGSSTMIMILMRLKSKA